MRVLILHNRYLQPGGEERVVEMDIRFLQSGGLDVERMEVSNRDIPAGAAWKAGPGAVWSATQYRATARRIREFRPDIVHVHNFFPLLSPSVHHAARAAGVAVVQSLHNYRLLCLRDCFIRDGASCEICLGRMPWPGVRHACYRGRRGASLVLLAMIATHRAMGTWRRCVDAFVVPSNFARGRFVAAGFPEDRLHVRDHAVEDPGPPAPSATREGAVFVGRLSSEKGVDTLIRAWRRRPVPGASLRIVGNGPERARLERMAEGDASIAFLGERSHDEVMRTIGAARLLVFPSVGLETFGLSIIEAFACGTPVLAARRGPAEDLVADGHSGWFFPPGDDAALAERMREAWADAAGIARRSIGAREDYDCRFTPRRAGIELLRIYDRALHRVERTTG